MRPITGPEIAHISKVNRGDYGSLAINNGSALRGCK